jgi:hypothetical protein
MWTPSTLLHLTATDQWGHHREEKNEIKASPPDHIDRRNALSVLLASVVVSPSEQGKR